MIIRKGPAIGIFKRKRDGACFLKVGHIVWILRIITPGAGCRRMKDGPDPRQTRHARGAVFTT